MSVLTDIEVDAEKALAWVTAETKKVVTAEPAAIAALAVLLATASTAIGATTAAAGADGLNIALDATALSAIKAAWPKVEVLAASLGIKL